MWEKKPDFQYTEKLFQAIFASAEKMDGGKGLYIYIYQTD